MAAKNLFFLRVCVPQREKQILRDDKKVGPQNDIIDRDSFCIATVKML